MAAIKTVDLSKLLKYDLVRIGQEYYSEKSHSIVVLSPEINLDDLKARRKAGSSKKKLISKEGDSKVSLGWKEPPNNGEYLRDWFLLIEREEKLDYIWVILKNQVERLLKGNSLNVKFLLPEVQNGIAGVLKSIEENFAAIFASNALEYEPSFKGEKYLESFVEIESQFKFPIDSLSGFPNVDFIRWFKNEICSTRIVICGGNEYEIRIEKPPGESWDWDIGNLIPLEEPSIVLDRKDYWFLWLKKIGMKIKIPKTRDFHIERSAIPDCLELKISNMQGQNTKYADLDPWDIASAIDQLGAVEVSIVDMNPQDWPDLWLLLDKLYNRVRVKIKVDRISKIPEWKLNLLDEVELHFDSLTKLKSSLNRAIGNSREREDGQNCLTNFKNPWAEKITVYVDLEKLSSTDAIKALLICVKSDLEAHIGFQGLADADALKCSEVQSKIEAIKRAFTRKNSGNWVGPKIKMTQKIAALWDREEKGLLENKDGIFSIFIDIFDMNFSMSGRKECEKFSIKKSNLRYGRWRPDIDEIIKTYNSWTIDDSRE